MIFDLRNIKASTICIPIFQATLRPQVKLYTLQLRFFIAHRFSELMKGVNFILYSRGNLQTSALTTCSLGRYVLLGLQRNASVPVNIVEACVPFCSNTLLRWAEIKVIAKCSFTKGLVVFCQIGIHIRWMQLRF